MIYLKAFSSNKQRCNTHHHIHTHIITVCLFVCVYYSDKLVKQAIVYSAVYNNNFNDPKKKYILTSNTLHSHYKIFIPHERLKQNVQAIKQLIENNPSISAETVTAPRRQALLVTNNHYTHTIIITYTPSSSNTNNHYYTHTIIIN